MGFKIRALFGADKADGKESVEVIEQDIKNEEESEVVDNNDTQNDNGDEELPVTMLEVEEPLPPGITISSAPQEESTNPAGNNESASNQDDEDEKQLPRKNQYKPRNIEELLMKAVPERANNATLNLRAILSKTILIELVPSGKKYLFDPTKETGVTVTESGVVETACTLQLHEKDLMKISDGNLNPQVLMLSHKAKVSGDPQVATHFFTLIAPPSYL
jgi:hypothetical protein